MLTRTAQRWWRLVFLVWVVGEGLWTVYLATALRETYTTHHWDIAWVGLDVAQVLVAGGLAWTWRRKVEAFRSLAVAEATMLLVDAWFDVITARRSSVGASLLAGVAELSLAGALLWIRRRVERS